MSTPRLAKRPDQRPSSRAPRQHYRRGSFVLAPIGRRSGVLLIVSLMVLTIFAGRLVQLQAIDGGALAAAAVDQRQRTVTLEAERGAITDSNGDPLAVTIEARNITADQTLVTDAAAVATQLAPLLGVDQDVLAARLVGEKRFMYVAKEVTPELWRRVEALRLPGIFSESTSKRVYPAEDLAANVIGFVGSDGNGLGGLEYALQSELAGSVGSVTYERGPGGKVIPTANKVTQDAVPGSTVQLTIDRDIQHVAQEAIALRVAQAQADYGTITVMDPQSGHILALATAPTFDPNNVGAAEAKNRGNRALSDVYEPGSTSKLMTIAAVIDQGAADPATRIIVPPTLRRADKTFHDHKDHGTLRLTLAGVMAESSNLGTILAAERIGGKQLFQYIKRFGIGEKTGLGFPGESAGFIPAYKDWSPTSFPTIAFGQGLSLNAVQAASVFSTIANDGLRVQPRLVSSIKRPDGSITTPSAPATTQVVAPETARTVRDMLEAVTQDGGTAPMARIPGYRVGGKTGTAQVVDPACGCYSNKVVASFIGMAPIDAPKLVVAVSIFNPRVGRFGGELAGPVFKRVMTYALQERQIPPTGTVPGKLALTFKK